MASSDELPLSPASPAGPAGPAGPAPEPLGDSVHFGVKWLGIAMGSQQLVRLGTTAILAHILLPEHFGPVTMATTGVYAISAFREMGFSQALIRRRSASEEEEHLVADTAFWILQATNVVLFVVGWLLAPWMGRFFDRIEELEPILRAMLVLFLVEGLSSVSAALLQKRMAFDDLAKNEIRSTAVYAVVSTVLAFSGFQAWSIVWGTIVSRITMISGLVKLSGWWPRMRFDRAHALELFRFGRWLWANALFQAATRSVDKLILGKAGDGASLGSYGVAYNLCTAPAKPANSILVRVGLPSMSTLQDDPDAMARAYVRGLALACFLALPATAGLIAVAPDFVATVYGNKWTDMAPLVRILPLYGLAYVLGAISGPLLLAMNRPRAIMVVQTGRQMMFFSLLYFLAKYGAIGMAWAVVLPTVAALLVGHVWAARACGIAAWDALAPVSRTASVTGVMTLAVLGVQWGLAGAVPAPVRLGLEVVAGVAVYVGLSWVGNRASCEDVVRQGRRLLRSRRGKAAGTGAEAEVVG